ncbi:MAG TPA: LytR family transcriptional regulator [Candidatus Latescibacteria bacterium]|nr:LytR family transcriptional regulator [Candidatus Latescibacterota bacterium]
MNRSIKWWVIGGLLVIICTALGVGLFLLDHRAIDRKSNEILTPIRVEVLNGCGEDGVARKFTDLLRRKGFDVVNFGNAENFDFMETIVVDRSGSSRKAEKVARALGVDNCIQQIKMDPYRVEDVLVIIGADFRRLLGGETTGR